MQCVESLRAQAYFDRELESPGAAEIERHAQHCGRCCVLLESLRQLRTGLRLELAFMRVPTALEARLARALRRESIGGITPVHRGRAWRPRAFWRGAFTGIGCTAFAASLAFFLSLMPEHLIDVVSTDKHTVKPWFSSHADVSPAVADFELQGYRLIGGRADYFDHQRAAVVVYQRGSHVINVFSWDSNQGALPKNTIRDGYYLAFWQSGDLAYCAVS